MSRKPHNICTARPSKDGKIFWLRVGSAWPDDKGGFNLTFDALPIPTMSEKYGLRVEAKIFPPRDDDGATPARSNFSQEIDDEIPF